MSAPPLPPTVEAALRHVPPGPGRDEVLRLVGVGWAFVSRQRGRARGHLHRYIAQIVAHNGGAMSFRALLDILETEAARRALHGERSSPVESVNRVWELVTIHAPTRGARKVAFKTLRNTLSACNKSKVPDLA